MKKKVELTPDQMKAAEMRQTEEKREMRKKATYGLYSLDWRGPNGHKFAPPFLAINDDVALDALLELVKSHPELQKRRLYCLGTFCAVNGKVLGCQPRLVAKKEVKKNEEISHTV